MILHADDVVASTRYRGRYEWYVCSREHWYLDRRPRIGGVILKNMGEAFTEREADQFLSTIAPYRVDVGVLREEIRFRRPRVIDDLADLWPVALVDFDDRALFVLEYEPWGLAERAPAGWRVDEFGLLEAVPQHHSYWVVDGEDIFRKLRGGP